jgi:pimeloyl-ACP methyl ester carboxylesterase
MSHGISTEKRVQIEKFLRLVLPAFTILFIGILVIFSVLIYKISHPGAVPEAVNPSHYLLPSLEIEIATSDGKGIPGWWIPGLKDAPAIILASGYGMNRGDALSLAAALHRNGFNTLIYSQRGSHARPKMSSTLGLREADDMLGAVRFLQSRKEINQERLGIWGTDIGARAALMAAASFPAIRALALDSPYEAISDFLDYRISKDFGINNRLVQFGCYQIFRLVHLFSGIPMNQRLPLGDLSDRAILFIKGENRRQLGSLTGAIYDRIEPQKEMISFKTARIHSMSGEDLRSYDRQVSSFFLLHLQ